MLAHLATFFDIVRLRKGPDAVPYSWSLCLVALSLWLLSGLSMTVMTPDMDDRDFLYGTFVGVLGLAVYAAIVVTAGRTPRLLQTLTAILGCGAIISFLFVTGNVLLPPVLSLLPFPGESTVSILLTLLLLWSIPVEGHIIARAIDRHWYLGVAVAMGVFLLQLFLYAAINPDTSGTA